MRKLLDIYQNLEVFRLLTYSGVAASILLGALSWWNRSEEQMRTTMFERIDEEIELGDIKRISEQRTNQIRFYLTSITFLLGIIFVFIYYISSLITGQASEILKAFSFWTVFSANIMLLIASFKSLIRIEVRIQGLA